MKKFGQRLLEHGLITAPQLDEALQCQVAFGGRLGTNLVELGYVKLDDVATVLAEQLGVPVPLREWVEQPDIQALKALPLALVRRARALPFRMDQRSIHVAMLDPRNTAHIAEIATATSRKVLPYLLPELRLHYWLERHYGIAREIRFVNVGREMARGRFLNPEVPPASEPRKVAAAGAADVQGLLRPLGAGQELTDEQSFASTYMDAMRGQGRASGRSAPAAVPPAGAHAAVPRTSPVAIAPSSNPGRAPLDEATQVALPATSPGAASFGAAIPGPPPRMTPPPGTGAPLVLRGVPDPQGERKAKPGSGQQPPISHPTEPPRARATPGPMVAPATPAQAVGAGVPQGAAPMNRAGPNGRLLAGASGAAEAAKDPLGSWKDHIPAEAPAWPPPSAPPPARRTSSGSSGAREIAPEDLETHEVGLSAAPSPAGNATPQRSIANGGLPRPAEASPAAPLKPARATVEDAGAAVPRTGQMRRLEPPSEAAPPAADPLDTARTGKMTRLEASAETAQRAADPLGTARTGRMTRLEPQPGPHGPTARAEVATSGGPGIRRQDTLPPEGGSGEWSEAADAWGTESSADLAEAEVVGDASEDAPNDEETIPPESEEAADAWEAPPPQRTIAGLEAEMMNAEDRDQIIAAALELAVVYTRCAALFVVHQGLVQGFKGVGDSLETRPLEGILFPVSCESVITLPASSGEVFRGRALSSEHDGRLMRALGRQVPVEVAVFPVRIRGRVVNLLYVDNGPERIGETAFAALSALVECMASAYERVILDRKRSPA